MNVQLHDPSDVPWLADRIDAETDSRQRDRYRVVELALADKQTLEIAAIVRRPRKFVQDWVYRYRDLGRDGLTPKKQPGRASRLKPEQVESFKRRLDAGVTKADGVCTLRGARSPHDPEAGVRLRLFAQRRVRPAEPPGVFNPASAAVAP